MEFLVAKLLGLLLVLTRVSAFFVSMPLFEWPAIPAAVKVAMAMLLTIFFAMVMPLGFNPGDMSLLQAGLLICYEAIYGFALGLATTMLFSTVKLAGTIIEQEMGLSMAEVLDPLTGEPGQAISTFLEMVFILLLLSANFHHWLLAALGSSFECFPIGSIPDITMLVTGVIQAGSDMLLYGFKLAAPMLAASMVLMIVLAIASKIMPEMDILFISLPIKIALGLVILALLLPYFNSYVYEFMRMMKNILPL
ncbi:MAG: flagellar biosynthetic protein FliR [Planctomycetes bacterium GWF2_50_10]|nr:MAG: flagellar biosynthetic protein FliR [Planctomycetes bacterium GWF2_50_10]